MTHHNFWSENAPRAQRFEDVRTHMNTAAIRESEAAARAKADKEAAEKRKLEAAQRQKIRCTQCGDMTYNPCRR